MKKFISTIIALTFSLLCLFSFSSCFYLIDYLNSSSEEEVRKQFVLSEDPILTVTLDEENNLYVVEVVGLLKNNSTETANDLTVYLSAFDAEGNLVCALQTEIYAVILKPGETWKFSAKGSYSTSLPIATSCNVSKVYFW